MKFILYSLNYLPELTGIGKYNGELAADLSKRGHDVSVVTGQPYYPEWERHAGFKNRWVKQNLDGVKVYRNPLYVPKKLTTVRRLVHLVSFALSSIVSLVRLVRSRPDVLLMVQPTLFCAPMALLFCKLTGAKSVMHIQDFEVDAMFGLRMGSARLRKLALWYERWCLKRFDVISSISLTMLENAERKISQPQEQIFFPNWADTQFVTPEIDGSGVRQAWGFSDSDTVILYSGNIGLKQGLELIIEAANALKEQPHFKFVIVGSGGYREHLERLGSKYNLQNLQFKPLQAWADVPKVLAMADIHLVIQKKGAADAVLPSKLTNILSAGAHCIVTAEQATELGRLEKKFPGIFCRIEPECVLSLVKGLEALAQQDTSIPNTIARDYAVDFLDKDSVINHFVGSVRSKSAELL